ncbi:MAG: hypothetical protein IJ020_03210 [Bacteroidaceae bacterium]|nr:hypothetical protein [Bacteroidaceae bacterium]
MGIFTKTLKAYRTDPVGEVLGFDVASGRMFARISRFLKDADAENLHCPSDNWRFEDMQICNICEYLEGYLMTHKGKYAAPYIADITLTDLVKSHKDSFIGLKRVCELVEFAKELEEKELLKIASNVYSAITPRAEKYFERAINIGYMQVRGDGYKWNWGGTKGAKARLAYFLERLYCPSPTDKFSSEVIRQLEILFDVVRLDRAISQNADTGKSECVKRWKEEIDTKIFFD